MPAGGVRADGREFHLNERLDGAAHVGAVLARDAHGEPTGVVYGADPMLPFVDALPAPTAADLVVALGRASARLAADGITATADADLGMIVGLAGDVAAYVAAAERGRFVQRIALMPGLGRLVAADEDPPTPGDVASLVPEALRDRLRVHACKLKADGALTTWTALLRDDYADEAGWRGRDAHEPGALAERIRRADHAGWQVATHAIGDAAIDEVLDALEALEVSGGGDERADVGAMGGATADGVGGGGGAGRGPAGGRRLDAGVVILAGAPVHDAAPLVGPPVDLRQNSLPH